MQTAPKHLNIDQSRAYRMLSRERSRIATIRGFMRMGDISEARLEISRAIAALEAIDQTMIGVA